MKFLSRRRRVDHAIGGRGCRDCSETAKIAPLAAYLASDAAREVSGQVFAVRANEIFLMGQSRPLRSVHRAEDWTPEAIGGHAMPALRAHFYPLERSQDVFSWDPI